MLQLKLPQINLRTTLFVFLCVLSVYGLSYYKRQASYARWMEDPSEYVVDHVTAMSTLDSYHWLRLARNLDSGALKAGSTDSLRGYPDLNHYSERPNLLTRFISLSSRFTEGDYYRAGLVLTPLLAGLFVFPLFLYCHALGFGASAILGGLIGSFSVSYYSRSDLGYVDTDMLNTFFPFAVSLFILWIRKESPPRTNLLMAIGAGVTMYLFNWWYQQPVFFLVYLFSMLVYLLIIRMEGKQIPWILLVFTLASGPSYVAQSVTSLKTFLDAYLLISPTGQIVWPDILTTIMEAQKSDVITKLQRMHGFWPFVFAGFSGLAYLLVTRFKKMVPIAPLLLLGFWSLLGPRRFTMYMAPFIGIGVGVLIELAVRKVGARFRLKPLATSPIAAMLMLALFFSTTGYTAYHIVPSPIPSAATTKAFLEIKNLVPKHSAMFTWWDQGYPLMEIGEFATYHDGALHGKARTTLVAKALTSTRQEEMVSLLAFLEKFGFDGLNSKIVEKNLSGDQMMQMVFSQPPDLTKEVYVLYVEDMMRTFIGTSTLGTWDFNDHISTPMTYEYLFCFSQRDNVINCKDCNVDLNRGIITDGHYDVSLKAALFVNDGHVYERIDYPVSEGDYLQVLSKGGKVDRIQVIEERLFKTNFNQQFVLGNYDRRYFEEVYNNYPVARVLKIKKPHIAH